MGKLEDIEENIIDLRKEMNDLRECFNLPSQKTLTDTVNRVKTLEDYMHRHDKRISSLELLDNGDEESIVTSCRAGFSWEKWEDEKLTKAFNRFITQQAIEHGRYKLAIQKRLLRYLEGK